MGSFLLLIACLIVYFLPAIIAGSRNHHNATAIMIVNVFVGWTVLGWIAALVWAFTNPPPR